MNCAICGATLLRPDVTTCGDCARTPAGNGGAVRVERQAGLAGTWTILVRSRERVPVREEQQTETR